MPSSVSPDIYIRHSLSGANPIIKFMPGHVRDHQQGRRDDPVLTFYQEHPSGLKLQLFRVDIYKFCCVHPEIRGLAVPRPAGCIVYAAINI